MINKLPKTTLVAIFVAALCFAQEAPPKLAVYVSGASGGINKSLGGKLLSAMSQSGKYSEIADPVLFQNELANSGRDEVAYIAQAAKRHGAEYVCVVGMTEALGAHSITARLAKVSDLQIIKTGTTDRALRSLDDLTAVSNELARQLLPPGSYVPSAPPSVFADAGMAVAGKEVPPDAQPASAGQCDKKYNLNEVLFKVKDGFPAKLKDCSSTLAKDMLNPFGGKKLEPKSFMTQCAVDGIKNELPDGFPNKDKIVGSLTNFIQGLMNAASAGGSLDPKKLVSAIGSMNIGDLLGDIKKLANNECVVDEPYEPPEEGDDEAEDGDDGPRKKKSSVSFGIRAGMNFSHTYAEYSYTKQSSYASGGGSTGGDYRDILGMQAGLVVDFAVSNWFHLQPGLMYIQKGMGYEHEGYSYDEITFHYLELPLLLSLKFSAFRLNAGPYLGFCLAGDNRYAEFLDIGLSTGVGFDIGMFYIGAFYNYGFGGGSHGYDYDGPVDGSGIGNFSTRYSLRSVYNRTLGINLGINL